MRFLALLLIVPILAGCLGYPDDAATLGDTVSVEFTAVATEHDIVLLERTGEQGLDFIIGADRFGLGERLDRALVGAQPGDVVVVQHRAGAVDFPRSASAPLELTSWPGDYSFGLLEFEDRIGEPIPGEVQSTGTLYDVMVNRAVINETTTTVTPMADGTKRLESYGTSLVRVLNVDTGRIEESVSQLPTETRDVTNDAAYVGIDASTGPRTTQGRDGTVDFRIVLRDGVVQRDFDLGVGGYIVSRLDTETGDILRRVDPVQGLIFPVSAPGNPLGLEPGAYRVLGADAHNMSLEGTPDTISFLLAQDVTFTLKVDRVTPAPGQPMLPEDNVGRRYSPVLKGDVPAPEFFEGRFGPHTEDADHGAHEPEAGHAPEAGHESEGH